MQVAYVKLFRLHVDDMDTLGRGLVSLKNLTNLAITKSDLDVIKFNRLLPYLTKCQGLQQIDFSFCKLRSSGANSVANFLKTAKQLKVTNLRGNKIDSDGVETLAMVMLWRRNNSYSAIELNLSTYYLRVQTIFHALAGGVITQDIFTSDINNLGYFYRGRYKYLRVVISVYTGVLSILFK